MPKLEYFVVCESVSVDQETNRISLFNVLEDIRPVAKDEPTPIVAQMVAVSAWNREPDDEGKDFQLIIRIHGPGDEPKDIPFNFRMERPRARLMVRIQGVPAQQAGDLKLELLLNSRHVATHSIVVHPATQQSPSPQG